MLGKGVLVGEKFSIRKGNERMKTQYINVWNFQRTTAKQMKFVDFYGTNPQIITNFTHISKHYQTQIWKETFLVTFHPLVQDGASTDSRM